MAGNSTRKFLWAQNTLSSILKRIGPNTYVIVGFDPGTVSALAAVDLDGSVLFTKEFRGGVKQAVSLLSKLGRPLMVASDKASSEAVSRLAASFGSVTFFPKKDLTHSEKARAVKKYGIKSRHEKDALAAAVHAYKKHKRLICRVRAREAEIFELLLKERVPNISRAVKPAGPKTPPARKRSTDLQRRVNDLQRQLDMAHLLLRESEKKGEGVRAPRRQKTRLVLSDRSKSERAARIRLEKELTSAHDRLMKIEVEMKNLQKARPKEKEDIRRKILRMIGEYKTRFRK